MRTEGTGPTAARAAAALALGLTVGCFDEPILEVDIVGTVRVPVSRAAEAHDIGVVYVGVYPGWNEYALGYPYPEMGPVVGDQRLGDTYPYGGTTVGAFGYACYQSLKCQVVTGRFVDLEEMVCAYGIPDQEGGSCTCSQDGDGAWRIDEGSGCLDPDEFWSDCSLYYGYNDPEEMYFVGEDLLNFQKVEDGGVEYWEAEYRIWHVVPFVQSVLYAFADNDMTSCNPEAGAVNRRRGIDGSDFFYEGAHFSDVLNFPDKYLNTGDLLSSAPVTITQEAIDAAVQGDPEQTERPEMTLEPLVLDYLR